MLYRWGDALPWLGKDVYVAPNATVIGRVRLGDQASVFGSRCAISAAVRLSAGFTPTVAGRT